MRKIATSRPGTFAAFILLGCFNVAGAEAPTLDQADDEKHFGSPSEMLFWTPEQQVAGYRNIERIFWTRPIKAGDAPHE